MPLMRVLRSFHRNRAPLAHVSFRLTSFGQPQWIFRCGVCSFDAIPEAIKAARGGRVSLQLIARGMIKTKTQTGEIIAFLPLEASTALA